MYQALYRKYRPRNFNEIAGQQVIVKTLKNAIINDRLSHAYLFTGPRGTGKTSIAKIVAKTINCECLNDFIPCDKCKSCIEFNSKNDVDIIEIDAASNNGVDEIREIRNKIDLVPSFSKFKVYIIDEVHMLTQGAFNALLKTLEEPPNHIVFILATTEPHKIPNTILSRCQRFDFKYISNLDIVSRLKYIMESEGVGVSDDVLLEVARLSDGGLRDSISLLDQIISYCDNNITVDDVHEVNGTIGIDLLKLLVDNILNNNFEYVFPIISEYNNNGKNLVKIVDSIIVFLKNILLSYEAPLYLEKNGYDVDLYKNYDIDVNYLILCINELSNTILNMRKSNNMLLPLEMCLLTLSSVNNSNNNKLDDNHIVSKENKNDKLDNKDIKVFKIHKKIYDFEEFKKIRVDNTLAKFNKNNLKMLSSKINMFNNYILDNEYGKWATMVLDGTLKAASDNYLIFVYDNLELSNIFNENFVVIENLVNKVFSGKYKIVSVSMEEWGKIRELFNSKKKQFNYIEEDNRFYISLETKENDEITSMFSDVIEYK